MDIVNHDNAGIKDVDESVICKGISLNESLSFKNTIRRLST